MSILTLHSGVGEVCRGQVGTDLGAVLAVTVVYRPQSWSMPGKEIDGRRAQER